MPQDKDWLIQWSGPSMRDEKFYDLAASPKRPPRARAG